MNKKIIILSTIIALIIIAIGVIYFINQSNLKKTVIDTNLTSSSDYYVEKGIEDLAIVAKSAVESYATQDIAESLADRNKRLGAYFTSDSPVYEYALDIKTIGSTASTTRRIAKVISITRSASEGKYPMLIVQTEITNYANNNKNTSSQSYWIIVQKNPDESYVANDIGIWLL